MYIYICIQIYTLYKYINLNYYSSGAARTSVRGIFAKTFPKALGLRQNLRQTAADAAARGSCFGTAVGVKMLFAAAAICICRI